MVCNILLRCHSMVVCSHFISRKRRTSLRLKTNLPQFFQIISVLSSGQNLPEISSVFSLFFAVCSFYFASVFNGRIHTRPEKAGNKPVVFCSSLTSSCVIPLHSSLWRGKCAMCCCYLGWVLCLQMLRSPLLYKAGNLK